MAIGFPTHGFLCPFCFSLGHPWPIYFLWVSSSLLLTLHFHRLLLTSLSFPDPITSFSSLGFMDLPILTFLYHILPMAILFLSFRASLNPSTSSRPICLFHELVIYYFCRLGLIVLPPVCQLFTVLVARPSSFYLNSKI